MLFRISKFNIMHICCRIITFWHLTLYVFDIRTQVINFFPDHSWKYVFYWYRVPNEGIYELISVVFCKTMTDFIHSFLWHYSPWWTLVYLKFPVFYAGAPTICRETASFKRICGTSHGQVLDEKKWQGEAKKDILFGEE